MTALERNKINLLVRVLKKEESVKFKYDDLDY